MDKTKIMIADDHPILWDGVSLLLQKEADFEVIGGAADGEEAIKLVDEKCPDVVLMDIEIPGIDGLEATKRIKAGHPGISIMILTVHDDDEYIAAFLEAGTAGYLLKTGYRKELVEAIRAVRQGVFVLDTQIAPRLFEPFTFHCNKTVVLRHGENLSEQEIDVVKLVGRGSTNGEIAQQLGMTIRAFKAYLSDFFCKLRVSSRTEATTACLPTGILSLDDL